MIRKREGQKAGNEEGAERACGTVSSNMLSRVHTRAHPCTQGHTFYPKKEPHKSCHPLVYILPINFMQKCVTANWANVSVSSHSRRPPTVAFLPRFYPGEVARPALARGMRKGAMMRLPWKVGLRSFGCGPRTLY